MARSQAKPGTKRARQQAQGKRPQGIEKPQQPLRRSARLQEARQKEAKDSLPSPPTSNPLKPKASHRSPPPEPKAITPSYPSPEPEANQKPERKRKRSQEGGASQGPSEKRPRAATNSNRLPADIGINGNPPSTGVNINGNPLSTDINGSRPLADTNDNRSRRIDTWLQKGSYPEDYLESGDQTWEDIKADTLARRLDADKMAQPHLGRKKSAASLVSLRRQVAEANMVVPTETIEDKSLPYRSPGYEKDLERCGGSYMFESPEGISDDSKLVCQNLLTKTQAIPQDTLFRNELFSKTCRKTHGRNEARIIEDISPLIAPSAETLATCGDTELEHLIFNVNERWGESIPITKTQPQPDRCVGFDSSAFSWPQQQRLKHCIGHFTPIEYVSTSLATWKMYFPFFACEAKSGTGDLDVADKQNAHSMTMAVRGIVELFKLINREDELHRKILAFSISHDASFVKIYGHYALIKDRAAKFYRHSIHEFSFTAQNGKDKWTAYQFTKNVYFEFMPELHKLICSAIDQISLPQASQGSNPPQQIPLNDSFASTEPESEEPGSQEIAASAPASQDVGKFKKPRLSANTLLKQQNEELARQLSERDGNTSEVVTMLRQQLSERDGNTSEIVTMLRQQNAEMKEQLEQQRDARQLSERDGNTSEVVTMLRQQNAEMKEQMQQQREEHKREMDELKDLLKQSLSAQPKQRGRR